MEPAQAATPYQQLLDELADSRIPKTEREHAAARRINELEEERAKIKSLLVPIEEALNRADALEAKLSRYDELEKAAEELLQAFADLNNNEDKRRDDVLRASMQECYRAIRAALSALSTDVGE